MSQDPRSFTAGTGPLAGPRPPSGGGEGSGTSFELILGDEPDAVRRARYFVRTSLGDSEPRADDAELVASELITNALLHGEHPIHLRVGPVANGVRIEVQDRGRTVPLLVRPTSDAMTGRGLALVGSLVDRWGVNPGPFGGKVVWAELGGTGAATPSTSITADIDQLLDVWAADEPDEAVYTVHLGPVATELLISAKAHLDNVGREVTLLREGSASSGEAGPPALAELVDVVTGEFFAARNELKREAAAAAASREPITDLVLHLPAGAATAGERYLAALDDVDRYARSARLLTLAPPPEHRLFRRWYVTALVAQLRARAAGKVPPPVIPFDLVLAQEVARLAPSELVSARLALLQQVNRQLAEATNPNEMAEIVVDNAMSFLQVESSHVWLADDGGELRLAATREREYDNDTANAEQSAKVVLLEAGDRVLGQLDMRFTVGELSDEAEHEVVSSLGDALAQSLARAELAASDRAKQETLALLSDASQILISAREPAEVLERLVELSVPRLADWCTVYLFEGDALRRVAMAIHGYSEAAVRFTGSLLPLESDTPQTRAVLTGLPQEVAKGAGRLLESLYPSLDFAALGGDADSASGLCQPILLRGEVVGVIALTFLGSGRKVTATVKEAIEGLAERVAIALDNASNWSAQTELVQSLVAALLPSEPPDVPGVAFAARYLPAGADVAGDWWEADLMADGTVLVGIGDAAGHGVAAVSDMCELRHGARALAAVERSPADLLADLNRRLSRIDAGLATAVYGRLNPENGRFRWACAGHVPPLHISAAGDVTILDSSRAAPLGVPGELPRQEAELVLGEGETLILYSDGVVERRDENLEDGIRRLAATASAHARDDLDVLADAIITEHCAQPVDDSCLLLIRRVGSDPAAGGVGG